MTFDQEESLTFALPGRTRSERIARDRKRNKAERYAERDDKKFKAQKPGNFGREMSRRIGEYFRGDQE